MLSLCLTNYNRYEMLLESFQHVYDDPRISEIVISDDCSKPDIYNKLAEYCKDKPKIQLMRQAKNVGMSRNKRDAIWIANNEWCILFDSDNVLNPNYLHAFYFYVASNLGKETPTSNPFEDPSVIYCPDFAKPEFDYREFSGRQFDRKEAAKLMNNNKFNMLANTCNYIVNRKRYLEVYQHDPKIKASDTIHFNYLWLKSGGSFYVVPNMQYFHRVHPGSGFLADTEYNLRQAEQTKKLIMQL